MFRGLSCKENGWADRGWCLVLLRKRESFVYSARYLASKRFSCSIDASFSFSNTAILHSLSLIILISCYIRPFFSCSYRSNE
jgi:hypothetical protein